MLTTHRDASGAQAGHNNVVDEAWKRRDAADEECGNGAPVAAIFGRVAVDTVEVIHIRYGHVTASDDIVATARDKTD